MANYPLANTASEINTALQAVVGADAEPTNGSQDMVTSNGVFDYIETQLGPFKTKTVTTESVGIAATDNDTSVPTCAAVNDAVTAVDKSFDSGFSLLGSNTQTYTALVVSGTASKDGFLIATATAASQGDYFITSVVAGVSFGDSSRLSAESGTLTVPIAQGESYSVTITQASDKKIYFKGIS